MSRFHQREVPGRVLTEFTNADALHPEMVALGVLHVGKGPVARSPTPRRRSLPHTDGRRRAGCGGHRLAHSSLTRRYKHLARDLGGNNARQVGECPGQHRTAKTTTAGIRSVLWWPGAGSNRRPSDSESNPLVFGGHYSTVPASCTINERDHLSVPNICHHVPPECGGKVGCRSYIVRYVNPSSWI
jgi:hypothetical protein